MRKAILFLLFPFFIFFCSTMGLYDISFSRVIDIDDQRSDLYRRAMTGIETLFPSNPDVIQYEDKELGVIVCKGQRSIVIEQSEGWYFNFKYFNIDFLMIINIKNNKVTVTIEDPQIQVDNIERYIVEESLYNHFVDRFINETENIFDTMEDTIKDTSL